MQLPLQVLSYLFKFNNQWKYNQNSNTIISLKNIYTFCESVKNHFICDFNNGCMIIVVQLQIFKPNNPIYKFYVLKKEVFVSITLSVSIEDYTLYYKKFLNLFY